MSHGKRNHSNGNSEVPQPQRQFPKPFTVKWSSDERWDKIMRHSQESCSHKPEHNNICVNLSDSSEHNPRDVSQKIGRNQFDGTNEPSDRADDEPRRRTQEVVPDSVI
jgi:hypothetical protein